MIHVLCFGNPYLKEDSLAVRIADHFAAHPVKGIEFIKCIAPDEVLKFTGKEFFILDVVKDLKEPMLFEDIDRIKADSMVSLHDFDLGFFLKLMEKTGRIDQVKIIGIPMDGRVADVKNRIIELIKDAAQSGISDTQSAS